MSKKFYAINRQTGERWRPSEEVRKARERGESDNECLIMYDSGFLGVLGNNRWYQWVKPLDPREWKTVVCFSDAWLKSRTESTAVPDQES